MKKNLSPFEEPNPRLIAWTPPGPDGWSGASFIYEDIASIPTSEFVCALCHKTISAKCSYATCENLDAGTRELVQTLDRVSADLTEWLSERVANVTLQPTDPAALRAWSERSFRDSMMRMAGKPDEHGLTPEQYLVRVAAPYEHITLDQFGRDPYAWFDTRELDKR